MNLTALMIHFYFLIEYYRIYIIHNEYFGLVGIWFCGGKYCFDTI